MVEDTSLSRKKPLKIADGKEIDFERKIDQAVEILRELFKAIPRKPAIQVQ